MSGRASRNAQAEEAGTVNNLYVDMRDGIPAAGWRGPKAYNVHPNLFR
jgi:hypothetical protein